MSEVSAAMGLTSLRSLDEFVAVNRRNHHAYRERLARIPGMQLFAYDDARALQLPVRRRRVHAGPGRPDARRARARRCGPRT